MSDWLCQATKAVIIQLASTGFAGQQYRRRGLIESDPLLDQPRGRVRVEACAVAHQVEIDVAQERPGDRLELYMAWLDHGVASR